MLGTLLGEHLPQLLLLIGGILLGDHALALRGDPHGRLALLLGRLELGRELRDLRVALGQALLQLCRGIRLGPLQLGRRTRTSLLQLRRGLGPSPLQVCRCLGTRLLKLGSRLRLRLLQRTIGCNLRLAKLRRSTGALVLQRCLERRASLLQLTRSLGARELELLVLFAAQRCRALFHLARELLVTHLANDSFVIALIEVDDHPALRAHDLVRDAPVHIVLVHIALIHIRSCSARPPVRAPFTRQTIPDRADTVRD